MKKRVKRLLRSIDEDKAKGLVMSDHDANILQALWLKLFGSACCSYPYLTLVDMKADLVEWLNSS